MSDEQFVFGPDDIPVPRTEQERLHQCWTHPERETVETEAPDVWWDDIIDDYDGASREDQTSQTVLVNYDSLQDLFDDLATQAVSHLPANASLKDRIIVLYVIFSDAEDPLHHSYLLRFLDCSKGYLTDFSYDTSREVAVHAPTIPESLRQDIIDRDDGTCVRCTDEHDLEVHHIIPRLRHGLTVEDNLVTLCADCHQAAHGGDYWDVWYDSKDEFWEWATA